MTFDKDRFKFKKRTRLDLSIHFYQKIIGNKRQYMNSRDENGLGCKDFWKVFRYVFLN